MHLFKKISITGLFLLIALTGGLTVYLYAYLPHGGSTPRLSVERSPEQLARGRYLAQHVTVCIDCHSTRDWNRFSGPVIPGTEGKGGELFSPDMGFPGIFYARNITPYHLKKWSDGQLYRLITTGIRHDGEPIFPVMPYPSYRFMDPRDVRALIAYIRTLKPIAADWPASQPTFPMNLIMRTIPQPPQPMRQKRSTPVSRGRYLATIAACAECHTQKKSGQPIQALAYAGGFEFKMPQGTVRSANITPDSSTGIGAWSADQFVEKFKQYDLAYEEIYTVDRQEFNTVMPWSMYGGMKEDDLRDIYAYLRTLKPVKNYVERFTPATEAGLVSRK